MNVIIPAVLLAAALSADAYPPGLAWHAVTSTDGSFTVQMPCREHESHGKLRIKGVVKPIASTQMRCVREMGFGGGSMTFEYQRNVVEGDADQTYKAFDIVSQNTFGTLVSDNNGRRITLSDPMHGKFRPRFGCDWEMNYVKNNVWYSAAVSSPTRFCNSVSEESPPAFVAKFFDAAEYQR